MADFQVSAAPILVVGATGVQGGAVVRALLSQKRAVRALVRAPCVEAARALEAKGVELAVGDLEDHQSLTRAVAGAGGVFSLQVPDPKDIPAETRQVGSLMRAARSAGVEVFIQSSVSEAKDHNGGHLPVGGWGREYWANKLAIEKAVLNAGFRSAVVLKPTLMMENLIAPKALWMFPELAYGRIVTAVESSRPVSFVAADDIGRMAAAAFADPERFSGAIIDLVGEVLTLSQVARILSKAWGEEVWAETHLIEDLTAGRRYLPWVQTQGLINERGFLSRAGDTVAWGLEPTKLFDWAEANRTRRPSRTALGSGCVDARPGD